MVIAEDIFEFGTRGPKKFTAENLKKKTSPLINIRKLVQFCYCIYSQTDPNSTETVAENTSPVSIDLRIFADLSIYNH